MSPVVVPFIGVCMGFVIVVICDVCVHVCVVCVSVCLCVCLGGSMITQSGWKNCHGGGTD